MSGIESEATTSVTQVGDQTIVFDVFLSDPFRVDLKLFECWTRGECEFDVIQRQHKQQQQQQIKEAPSTTSASGEGMETMDGEGDVSAHVRHQFHFFRFLAEKLERPCSLLGRLELHLPLDSQPAIIEKFYSFDDEFVRELVGEKLTTNLRRDIDDIAEKTGITLASCQRQFDNLRRVWKVATSTDYGSSKRSVVTRIGMHFRLPARLAERYARFTFLTECRPSIDDKRISQALTRYVIIEDLAQTLMFSWTNRLDISLEQGIFVDVRATRARIKKERDTSPSLTMPMPYVIISSSSSTTTMTATAVSKLTYRKLVIQQLSLTKAFSGEEALDLLRALDGKFRSVAKTLASIGSEIADWKEVRDLFEDLVIKVVDPFRMMGITKQQMGAFFDMMILCSDPDTIAPKHRPEVAESWRRFLGGIKGCALILFDVVPPL